MKTSGPVRVLLVDDHPVVRTGLRVIAEVDPGITVVGEAGSASEALDSVRQLLPDLVLLDVRMPDRSGLEVCRVIRSESLPTRVLFLTSFADNPLVLAAMQAGGDGYLLKDNQPKDIVDAIHTVMRGGTMFDPIVTRAVEQELQAVRPSPPADLLSMLSAQETRVLSRVAEGKTDKEIASDLGLQPKTVRNYLERIFEKLGVRSRTQAAVLFDRRKR